MAVEVIKLEKMYRCTSSDTKPTNPAWLRLVETDTGQHYIWNGTSWVVYQEA